MGSSSTKISTGKFETNLDISRINYIPFSSAPMSIPDEYFANYESKKIDWISKSITKESDEASYDAASDTDKYLM